MTSMSVSICTIICMNVCGCVCEYVMPALKRDVIACTCASGATFGNQFGTFHHDDIIGKPYGAKVRDAHAENSTRACMGMRMSIRMK